MARRQQFAAHLAPVWLALPEEARGPFYVWTDEAQAEAERIGVTVTRVSARSPQRVAIPEAEDEPTVVAGYADMLLAYSRKRRIVLASHGIGQSYAGRPNMAWMHIGSPGGLDRGMVSLFLHPGPHPAARDRERYPRARVEVVGSPRLDRLHHKARDGRPVIAIATHWCATLPGDTPETHGSLVCPHFGGWYGIHDAIAELSRRMEVIGHGHPRLFSPDDRLGPMWDGMGIEVVRDFDEVCRRADVLVCDNSSVSYEFAATGRPVVLLDPPWYDTNVGHGLRFWSASHVGLHVSDPRCLTDVVGQAVEDGTVQRRDREDALSMVYGYRDHAAERAAVVLLDWLGERRMAA